MQNAGSWVVMTRRTRAPHITEVAGSVGPSQDIGPSKLEAMTCAPQVSGLAEDHLIGVFPKVTRLFDTMATHERRLAPCFCSDASPNTLIFLFKTDLYGLSRFETCEATGTGAAPPRRPESKASFFGANRSI
jgi:hypothetical protein